MLSNLNIRFTPEESELGKTSAYDPSYNPEKLFAIPRQVKRDEINIDSSVPLPFHGDDRWNHYEVSWLNAKGKPIVAVAQITYACTSPNIIESKSMKLYFNSLNNTQFLSDQCVAATIKADLESKIGSPVSVTLTRLQHCENDLIHRSFKGKCLDDLDISCHIYQVCPDLLSTDQEDVSEETLYSDLLKSNCLVTTQPDWGSVQITYSGKKINEAGLLRYIVSYRNHNEFHEQCIERIFMDIKDRCQPTQLTVRGKYTRRGGVDINPTRSTEANITADNARLYRQ